MDTERNWGWRNKRMKWRSWTARRSDWRERSLTKQVWLPLSLGSLPGGPLRFYFAQILPKTLRFRMFPCLLVQNVHLFWVQTVIQIFFSSRLKGGSAADSPNSFVNPCCTCGIMVTASRSLSFLVHTERMRIRIIKKHHSRTFFKIVQVFTSDQKNGVLFCWGQNLLFEFPLNCGFFVNAPE